MTFNKFYRVVATVSFMVGDEFVSKLIYTKVFTNENPETVIKSKADKYIEGIKCDHELLQGDEVTNVRVSKYNRY